MNKAKIKALYKSIYHNQLQIDFCMSTTDDIVELRNDAIYVISKLQSLEQSRDIDVNDDYVAISLYSKQATERSDKLVIVIPEEERKNKIEYADRKFFVLSQEEKEAIKKAYEKQKDRFISQTRNN